MFRPLTMHQKWWSIPVFTIFTNFYRAAYMQGGLSYGKRVRPSVCLSVTHKELLWPSPMFRTVTELDWKKVISISRYMSGQGSSCNNMPNVLPGREDRHRWQHCYIFGGEYGAISASWRETERNADANLTYFTAESIRPRNGHPCSRKLRKKRWIKILRKIAASKFQTANRLNWRCVISVCSNERKDENDSKKWWLTSRNVYAASLITWQRRKKTER